MEVFRRLRFASFTISILSLIPAGLGCYPSDRVALLNFSRQLQPNPWPNASELSDCCHWAGVRCAGNNSVPVSSRRVTQLVLPDMGLRGTLSVSLGRMDRLERLNLHSNALYGSIPNALFYVQSLVEIDLGYNDLYGHLNPAMGNLSSLVSFSIHSNHFSGTIPDVFHCLAKTLQLVDIGGNNFSGLLPPSLVTCSMLIILALLENSLTIHSDVDFSNFTNLDELYLGPNWFPNGIPNSIFSCRKLTILSCEHCNLHGEFPHQYNHLHSLQILGLSWNNFFNINLALSILSRCSNIHIIILNGNFNGETMPNDTILRFPSLQHLAISGSQLLGSIPLWISKCSQLVSLVLNHNQLRGSIPPWIGRLKHMRFLGLRNNLLTGEIPETLARPGSPTFVTIPQRDLPFNPTTPTLDLSDNLLHGTSWMSLGNLTHLGVLNLSRNFLSGSIPDIFSNMKEFEVLDLSSNNITGTIPPSLEKLTFLRAFNVANNNLEGDIPTGGQFFTFPCSSFSNNPKLHLSSVPNCNKHGPNPSIMLQPQSPPTTNYHSFNVSDIIMSFALGMVTGFFPICWCIWHFKD